MIFSAILAILSTSLCSYMHGQDWPIRNKGLPIAVHVLCMFLTAWLAGLNLYLAVLVAPLTSALFWVAMRRGAEAAAELDGLDRMDGRVYDAIAITLNYVAPVAGIGLFTAAIFYIHGEVLSLILSALTLASLAVPAAIVQAFNYEDRKDMLSPGGSKNRAITEAVIGAAPCGLSLGTLIAALSVL